MSLSQLLISSLSALFQFSLSSLLAPSQLSLPALSQLSLSSLSLSSVSALSVNALPQLSTLFYLPCILVTEKPPILDIESESPGDLDSQISAFSSEIDLTAKSVLVYIWTSTPGKGLKSYSYSWFTHNKIAII